MQINKSNRTNFVVFDILIHTFFLLISVLLFIIPFIYVVSASFSNEEDIINYGFSLFPKHFEMSAYNTILSKPDVIINAYAVTAFQAILGTLLSVALMSMCAYSLSRKSFKIRKQLTFYIFFVMIFNAGLIPTYIIYSQYYHLQNSIWVYIFPSLITPMYLFIIRTFFMQLPEALVESAKIDGAGEVRILWQIVLPMSKPVLATVALLTLLDRWNNWYTTLIYISNTKLFTLQFLLQKIMMEAQAMMAMMDNPMINIDQKITMPVETLRYAICVIAAGPMLLVFPFFQKYFTKGLTVGAIKG